MPRQIVPNTDKICQEEFLKAFFQSTLQDLIKMSKKSKLKQILRLSQIICFKELYEQWEALFVRQDTHTLLSGKCQRKFEF